MIRGRAIREVVPPCAGSVRTAQAPPPARLYTSGRYAARTLEFMGLTEPVGLPDPRALAAYTVAKRESAGAPGE